MMQSPRFNGHAEQRALLGSAAVLDPKKFPRRYQQHQRQQALAELDRKQQEDARKVGRERTAERAAFYCDLTMREAAAAMPMSYDYLRRIASEFGLKFKTGVGGRPTRKQIEPCKTATAPSPTA